MVYFSYNTVSEEPGEVQKKRHDVCHILLLCSPLTVHDIIYQDLSQENSKSRGKYAFTRNAKGS